MSNYQKFKERICCNKNSICTVGAYKIEVVLDESRKECCWDKLLYLMNGGECKIYMCNANRTIAELTFDFYREVGKLYLYNKLITLHKADKYYDKMNLSPAERTSLVEDMTVDEYAAIQMSYSFKPTDVLPFVTKNQMIARHPAFDDGVINSLLEKKNASITIRREYLTYIFEANKKSIKLPKRERNIRLNDDIDDAKNGPYKTKDPILDDDKKKEERRFIRNISAKMSLTDWSNDFTENVKNIIRVYTTDFNLLTIDDFVLKTKEYVPLYNEPADWKTPMKYYRQGDDKTYHQFKKVPDFVSGMFYQLVEYDEKQLMKSLYDEYHGIVSTFVVKYYDCYRKSFSVRDRYMYQYIIENGLNDYIEHDIVPTPELINRLKIEYYNSINSTPSKLSTVSVGMLSYNERKNILNEIIDLVAESYHIEKYKIDECYELTNSMNRIVDTYFTNPSDKKIDAKLEKMVLPYIIRIGA